MVHDFHLSLPVAQYWFSKCCSMSILCDTVLLFSAQTFYKQFTTLMLLSPLVTIGVHTNSQHVSFLFLFLVFFITNFFLNTQNLLFVHDCSPIVFYYSAVNCRGRKRGWELYFRSWRPMNVVIVQVWSVYLSECAEGLPYQGCGGGWSYKIF